MSGGHRFTHLIREPHCLLKEGFDDVGLLHCLDHFAADEDLAFAIAGGYAEVRLACLARSVENATHHSNAERHLQSYQSGSYLVGKPVNINLVTAAGRTGNDLQMPRPQVQRFQDLDADLDL